jgi:hypothetical protein
VDGRVKHGHDDVRDRWRLYRTGSSSVWRSGIVARAARQAGEVVGRVEPGQAALGPDVAGGRQRRRIVEGRDGHVDPVRAAIVAKPDRAAAARAERALGVRAGANHGRRARGNLERLVREDRPGDHRRAARAPAYRAVAVDHRARRAPHPVAHRSAQAAAVAHVGYHRSVCPQFIAYPAASNSRNNDVFQPPAVSKSM